MFYKWRMEKGKKRLDTNLDSNHSTVVRQNVTNILFDGYTPPVLTWLLQEMIKIIVMMKCFINNARIIRTSMIIITINVTLATHFSMSIHNILLINIVNFVIALLNLLIIINIISRWLPHWRVLG